MEQAMQELLGVIKTLPQEQVIKFVLDIFAGMSVDGQTALISQMSQIVGVKTDENSAMSQKSDMLMEQDRKNPMLQEKQIPQIDLNNMF